MGFNAVKLYRRATQTALLADEISVFLSAAVWRCVYVDNILDL